MRAKKFTFKKTKRVKTVTEHNGVCLDLTDEEARKLRNLVRYANWNDVYKPLASEIDALLTREID